MYAECKAVLPRIPIARLGFVAVDPWLQAAVERLARETGSDAAEYELDQTAIDDLLDLARIAAHESGERTNAPLVCYLVGLARGRRGGVLEDLTDAVAARGSAS